MTTTLDRYLTSCPDRCSVCGHHVPTQSHGALCAPIAPADEWQTFLRALRSSVRSDGTVHVNDVRPKVQGIYHKDRGLFWARARREGYIKHSHKEPSTDTKGRNTDKDANVDRALPKLLGMRVAA